MSEERGTRTVFQRLRDALVRGAGVQLDAEEVDSLLTPSPIGTAILDQARRDDGVVAGEDPGIRVVFPGVIEELECCGGTRFPLPQGGGIVAHRGDCPEDQQGFRIEGHVEDEGAEP